MRYSSFFFSTLLLTGIACKQPKSGQTDQATPNKQATADSNTVGSKSSTAADTITYAQAMQLPQVPVLCYHRIHNGASDEYTVTPAAFAAHMQILKDSGYNSISPEQLNAYLRFGQTLPPKPVMITFDDTRLEHFTIAAPEMEKRGMRGVFFIMTIAIGKKNYMSKQQLRTLDSMGHTIGTHTWDHHMATKYTADDWAIQLDGSQKTLQAITGKVVEYLAYPFGLWNEAAAQHLRGTNIKLAFILSTRRSAQYLPQTVRRMIVPYNWSPAGMLKSMQKTFGRE
jgi:peptidoglycan/xylan/chitin deacetylase (PgdA/CDA1 family)